MKPSCLADGDYAWNLVMDRPRRAEASAIWRTAGAKRAADTRAMKPYETTNLLSISLSRGREPCDDLIAMRRSERGRQQRAIP